MMEISKEAFLVPRTPHNLALYVTEAYDQIRADSTMVKLARMKREPYKTFVEELLPFSIFCSWKYSNLTNVVCSLVPGTPGRDAVVRDLSTGQEHSVEITWPMDGASEIRQGQKLNEQGFADGHVWDWHDTDLQEQAIQHVLDIAQKKALRDYRFPGGSTLIFVFDREPLFWSDNTQHARLLDKLIEQLQQVPFRVSNVLLLLMPKREMVTIKADKDTTL